MLQRSARKEKNGAINSVDRSGRKKVDETRMEGKEESRRRGRDEERAFRRDTAIGMH